MTLLADLMELDNCLQRISQNAGIQVLPRVIFTRIEFLKLLIQVENNKELHSHPTLCVLSKDHTSLMIEKIRLQSMHRPSPRRLLTPSGIEVPVGEMGVVHRIQFTDHTEWDGDKGWIA